MSKLRASAANQVANHPSATAASPMLEPTTRHFIDALVAACDPPLYTLTAQAARKVLSGAQAGADKHFTAGELLLKVSAAS